MPGYLEFNQASGSSSGTAGGDLSGTYPNPTVAKIRGRAVSASAPNNTDYLGWSTANSDWEPTPIPSVGGYDTLIPFSQIFTVDDDTTFETFSRTYAGATFKPTLLLDELRDYTVTRAIYIGHGFKVMGAFDNQDVFRSQHPTANRLKMRLTAGTGWLKSPYSVISSASYAGGTRTYNTSSAHNLHAGDVVGVISTPNSNAWRFSGLVLATPSSTQFTVTSTDPGVAFSSGFVNSEVWNVTLSNLSFDGPGTGTAFNRIFEPPANFNHVFWLPYFHNISMQGCPGFMGTPATTQSVDGMVCDGVWDINNLDSSANGCFWNVGGSDSKFRFSECFADTPTEYPIALFRFNNMSKTEFSGGYLTGRGNQPINSITTPDNGSQDMWFVVNNIIEGHNNADPIWGAAIYSEDDMTIANNWISYAMSNPSAAVGGATLNKGVIHSANGHKIVTNITYQPATGVAFSVPFVYIEAGSLRISNILGDAPELSVSAASWGGGITQFTTSLAHNLDVGDCISIGAASPTGYNQTGVLVASIVSPTVFTVPGPVSNPGAYSSGAKVIPPPFQPVVLAKTGVQVIADGSVTVVRF